MTISSSKKPCRNGEVEDGTVFIGGSNLGKITKAAADNRHMVVDLTEGSWTLKSGLLEKIAKKTDFTKIGNLVFTYYKHFKETD
jgi:hypothetical protein